MNSHALYLAIIAVLVIVIVYAAARAVRALRIVRDVTERFGIRELLRASVPRSAPLRRVTLRELLRPRTYDEYQREMESLIARAISLGEFGKRTKLSEACEHALKGGKRLRSIILMEITRTVGMQRMRETLQPDGDREPPIPVDPADAALFIEYLHSASLIVDDLPEFDNDLERRGAPTVHAATSPATAQMASIALVSAAFQNICRQIDWVRDNCPEIKNADRIGAKLCFDISRAIGIFGAAGGQYMDMSPSDTLFSEYGPNAVMDLMYKKTATFFEIATTTGWLIAGGSPGSLEDVRAIGKHLGIAFQIADDIGDMDKDAIRREKGKPGWNLANEIGKDAAERELTRNLRAARLHLERHRLWTKLWEEIIQKVVGMTTPEPSKKSAHDLGQAPSSQLTKDQTRDGDTRGGPLTRDVDPDISPEVGGAAGSTFGQDGNASGPGGSQVSIDTQ